MRPAEPAIRSAISGIEDPCSVSVGCALSIDEMGLITGLDIGDDGDVHVEMRLTMPGCIFGFIAEIELVKRIGQVENVRSVSVDVTNDVGWSEADISEDGRRRLAAARQERKPLLQISPRP